MRLFRRILDAVVYALGCLSLGFLILRAVAPYLITVSPI